jgi:hypothetical protein
MFRITCLSRSACIFIACLFIISACRSNTPFDALVYDAEWQLEEMPIQSQLCQNLEALGYQFDSFNVYQESITVAYPDEPVTYTTANVFVLARELSSINRDFNAVEQISEEELARLQPLAEQLCLDIQNEARNLGIDDVGVSFVLYDWIDGVTISYGGNTCDTLTAGSIGLGSYGHEEQFEESICTDS